MVDEPIKPVTLDGIALEVGDTFLRRDQPDAKDNGVYMVTGIGRASEPAVLTYEMLVEAFKSAERADYERAMRTGERLKGFYASIPEALHDHPAVRNAAAYIGMDIPLHPRHAQDLSDKINQAIRDHEARG